jgi:hypothetical protein
MMWGNIRSTGLAVGLLMVLGSLTGIAGTVSADVDGNDDFNNAEPITPGHYTGSVSGSTDQRDFYKIEVPQGRDLSLNATITGSSTLVDIYSPLRYYINGTFHNDGESFSRVIHLNENGAGTYYIGFMYGPSTYSFDVGFCDQNDGGITGDAPASFVNARQVGAGLHEGSIGDLDALDFYSFQVSGGALINLTLSAGTVQDATCVTMALYGPKQNFMMETGWVEPGKAKSFQYQTSNETPGTYYLCMTAKELYQNNYTFDIELISQNDGGSGIDAPAFLADAVPLKGGGLLPGSLGDADAADWYRLNVTDGQVIQCTMNVEKQRNGTDRLQLFNRDKVLVDMINWTKAGASNSSEHISNESGAGTWFILVEGKENYTLNLTLADQFDGGAKGDAGDTMEKARPVTPNRLDDGLLGGDDTKDYYRFIAAADHNIQVVFNFKEGTGLMKAYLYDPEGTELVVSDDVPPANQGTMEYIPTVEGPLYFLITATDAVYDLKVVPPADPTAPTIAITSPINHTILTVGMFDLAGTASDNVGVVLVEVSVDGQSWLEADGTTSWSYSGLNVDEGIHSIWARATDYSGNQKTAWIMVAYAPGGGSDTKPPAVAITSPANGTMLNSRTINITGTASDDFEVTAVAISLDGVTWLETNGTGIWTLDNITFNDGITTIRARATDFMGNIAISWIAVGYNPNGAPDIEPPQVAIIAPVNGTLAGATVDISGTSLDNFGVFKVEVSLDSFTWSLASGTTDWSYAGSSLPDGITTIQARATDFSGNAKTAWVIVGHRPGGAGDTVRPQVAIDVPANGTMVDSRTLNLTGTASDDFGVYKVEVSLDGASWLQAHGTAHWSYAGLMAGNGIISLWARSTDFAGNSNITIVLVGYRSAGGADAVKPTVKISSHTNGTVLPKAPINLTGTASDDFGVFKVDVSLNAIDWWPAAGTTSWTYTGLALGDGGNTIWVRATDFAGNSNTTSIFVTYIAGGDKAKPTITLTSIKDKAKVSKAKLALLSGTASDNVAVKALTLKVNDADVAVTFAGGVWTATNVTLHEGKNTILVTATDSSGNVQTATYTITYEKPKSQPGFELPLMVLAVAIGLLGLGRRRK